MGAFAEYTVVAPSSVAMFEVPKNITRDAAPVMELVIAASRALMPLTDRCAGKRLAILGLGPSGLVVLQYAKALGFAEVIGWDLYPQRRACPCSLGIDAVYDPGADGFDEAIRSMPEADFAVDMMGDELLGQSTFTKLLRKIRPHGTLVSYGHPEHGRTFSPFVFQSRNLTMVSPENDLAVIREKGRALMAFVADGRVRVEPLITRVEDFEQLGPVFERLLAKLDTDIKIVFRV